MATAEVENADSDLAGVKRLIDVWTATSDKLDAYQTVGGGHEYRESTL